MKQIGEFANENQVTIKALHHYEKLGLISPAKVDEFTGYRYYEEKQASILKIITQLKFLGFSLSEIKELLDAKMSEQVFLKFLFAKKKQAEMDIDSSKVRHRQIVTLLKALDGKSEYETFDIKEIISMKIEDIAKETKGHEMFKIIARQSFEQAVKNNTPLCVVSTDIDRFDSVNVNYGHDVGDIVIERIVNVAVNSFTHIDPKNELDYTIIENIGDECRIMISTDVKTCEKLAQYILDGVRKIDFADVADDLHVTVTIGVASIETKNISSSHLFHLADTALYEAKSKERGTYLVYSE